MILDFFQNTVELAQYNLPELILLVNLYLVYEVRKLKRLISY